MGTPAVWQGGGASGVASRDIVSREDLARSDLDRAGETPPPSAEGGWGTPGGKPPGGGALKSP